MSSDINLVTLTLSIAEKGDDESFVQFQASSDEVTISFPNSEQRVSIHFEVFLYAMKGFVAQLELLPRREEQIPEPKWKRRRIDYDDRK